MATESFRRRSPSADVSLGSSSDLELPPPSAEVCVGIDGGAFGPPLTSSESSPRTSVPASEGSAEEKKLEAGNGVPLPSPSAASGNGSVKRTTRASVSSSSVTAEDVEPSEVNGSPPAKKKKKKGAASKVPASPDDCSASSKPKKLDGARSARAVFVGDPVPEEEARRRWPYRFVQKNTTHNARANAHNVDDDEIILDVESHFLQASISGCILDIGDCAYVKGEKGKPNYVGRILEFFKTTRDEYYFRVQWFFRAQDTVMKDQAKFHDKKRLFYSDLQNDNLLDCIVSKVQVTQVPPRVDLKSSMTSSCEYYYDMKYSLDYSTFSVINTRNEEEEYPKQSHFSQNTELALLDLYSGCGGMSTGLQLGAHIAGVTLAAKWAVDHSEAACKSFKLNHPETQVRNETADDFFSLLKEWKKLCKMYMVNNVKLESSTHHEESKRECIQQPPGIPDGEYEVLKLVDICYGDPTNVGKRGLKFKVRWKGYSPSEDTWEPIGNLRNCQDRIREFVIEWSKAKQLPLPGDVDVVCGGPPCQGISGYNRFRNFEAPLEDERNRQIVVFMDIVEFLKPKYVLMENVVDILKFAKATLGRYAISRLVSNNYQARLGMMAAGCYGLPQFRLRTFIWGCHPNEKLPQFPLPTHETILKGGTSVEFERNLVGYDEGQQRELEKTIVLEDALSDLPPVKNLEVHEKMDYGKSPQTEFQKYIRTSKYEMLGLTTDGTSEPNTLLYDHYPSPLSEDDYLRVCQIPHRKGANFRDLPGVIIASNNTVHLDPKMEPVLLPSGRQLVPNYAMSYWDGKSLRPFSRLWWDEVVATVLTIPDCHCQTILHPEQDRVLTIRECARLQGFPDYYRFAGTVKERYQQIGNAVAVSVSRVLGYALAMAWLGKVGNEPRMTLPSKFSLLHNLHNLNPSSSEVINVDSLLC